MAEGGEDHHLVVPGGIWWKLTQWAIAEMEAKRVGDTKRLEEIEAERKAHSEAVGQSLLRAFGTNCLRLARRHPPPRSRLRPAAG